MLEGGDGGEAREWQPSMHTPWKADVWMRLEEAGTSNASGVAKG